MEYGGGFDQRGGGFDQRGMVGNGGAAMSVISQPNMRDLGHATADIFSRRPSSSRSVPCYLDFVCLCMLVCVFQT